MIQLLKILIENLSNKMVRLTWLKLLILLARLDKSAFSPIVNNILTFLLGAISCHARFLFKKWTWIHSCI